MFCPQCSQEQVSNDTRFCSRCGFPMSGVAQLIANNGMSQQLSVSQNNALETPRKKGMKKGGKLMLVGLILVPLVLFFSLAVHAGPFLTIIASVLFFWGGLLRIIYASIFESNRTLEKVSDETIFSDARKFFDRKKKPESISAHETMTDSDYLPPTQMNWRDTNDLSPSSITEETTKLLHKDQ